MLVLEQVGAAPKAVTAPETKVMLLTCVQALALQQVTAKAEALETVPTAVGLLTSVRALVLDQVGANTESLNHIQHKHRASHPCAPAGV
jgi:hypothetical protein